ncbi:hypothetical protein JCM8208_004732 [Rhodotorula glutinis]
MAFADELERNNEKYVATFGDKGSLPLPPAKKLAILSCMDARFDSFAALGLQEGDAHHIRNAGGRFDPDAVRSLIISQELLGTREVVVVHHTGCGMLTFERDDLRGLLAEREGLSDEARALASRIETHEFGDLEESVREDVAAIRRHPLVLEGTPVSGWVYEVETGRVRRLV